MRWILALASVGAIVLAGVACGGDGGGAGAGDEEEIRRLNQDFLRYFQGEQWSEAYELYSREFKERCSREDFLGLLQRAKGLLGEEEWESTLKGMRLVAVENVQIEGHKATADVTSEVLGERRTETEHYAKEDGKWRLAPRPGTEGCES